MKKTFFLIFSLLLFSCKDDDVSELFEYKESYVINGLISPKGFSVSVDITYSSLRDYIIKNEDPYYMNENVIRIRKDIGDCVLLYEDGEFFDTLKYCEYNDTINMRECNVGNYFISVKSPTAGKTYKIVINSKLHGVISASTEMPDKIVYSLSDIYDLCVIRNIDGFYNVNFRVTDAKTKYGFLQSYGGGVIFGDRFSCSLEDLQIDGDTIVVESSRWYSINSDYYNFSQSLGDSQRARDDYAEPVFVYSNIDNAYGIFRARNNIFFTFVKDEVMNLEPQIRTFPYNE